MNNLDADHNGPMYIGLFTQTAGMAQSETGIAVTVAHARRLQHADYMPSEFHPRIVGAYDSPKRPNLQLTAN